MIPTIRARRQTLRAPRTPSPLCYRVSSSYSDGIKEAALTSAVNTIRRRDDEGHRRAHRYEGEKGDDIIVELPGVDDESISRIKDIIARTARSPGVQRSSTTAAATARRT
ncbi:MAG: hypothetical protein IPI49_33670 [Myxococcales bacterium]|nr:hypothetical protein [Myxococcales bacterium]